MTSPSKFGLTAFPAAAPTLAGLALVPGLASSGIPVAAAVAAAVVAAPAGIPVAAVALAGIAVAAVAVALLPCEQNQA